LKGHKSLFGSRLRLNNETQGHLFPGNPGDLVSRGLKPRFSGYKVTSFRVRTPLKSPVSLFSVTSFRVISHPKVTFYPEGLVVRSQRSPFSG
jgi:hypothetical protein